MTKTETKDWTGGGGAIWKTLGASNHTAEERELNDYYATDPIAIDKLLAAEQPPRNVWECAAGGGHLAKRLREKGYNVLGTDIIQRGGVDLIADFLKCERLPLDGCCILTNPPYKYAKDFVLKALELLPVGGRCYMFLKLTFLEGKARFGEIFSRQPPRKVLVFSERVLCAKNAEFERMKEGGGSAVAYAWFVWEKGHTGDTIVQWI